MSSTPQWNHWVGGSQFPFSLLAKRTGDGKRKADKLAIKPKPQSLNNPSTILIQICLSLTLFLFNKPYISLQASGQLLLYLLFLPLHQHKLLIICPNTLTPVTAVQLFLSTPAAPKMSAGIFAAPVAGSSYVGLKTNVPKLLPAKDSIAWSQKTVSNGSRTHCMKTWNPINNKKFETLSYLPPLSDDSIAKQIEYMMKKGWIPCLEFDEVGLVQRENSRIPGYYDGRYWTLWKLPMFGCNDSSQVLNEIHECKKAYPNAHIRCLAFDSKHQAQCMSFLIQKPT